MQRLKSPKRGLLISLALMTAMLTSPIIGKAQTPAEQVDSGMVLTLLGTGTPLNSPDQFGFSNLVQAGGLNLIFDAGRGATIRLGQLGIPLGKIDAIFLTHFHSDHVNGLADLYLTGYIPVPTLGGRKTALHLYGPPGTKQIANGLMATHRADIETRIADEAVPREATEIVVSESSNGVIFERNGVRVTSFPVLHGEKIKPSVGYRIDYKQQSVVFSGDTKHDQNVISFGKGATVLVHEVGAAPSEVAGNPIVQSILDHHTSPEDAGRVFSSTQPKIAVYSHAVRLFGSRGQVSVREIVDRTRTTYSGPLVVGEDLTQFRLNEEAVTILKGGRPMSSSFVAHWGGLPIRAHFTVSGKMAPPRGATLLEG